VLLGSVQQDENKRFAKTQLLKTNIFRKCQKGSTKGEIFIMQECKGKMKQRRVSV